MDQKIQAAFQATLEKMGSGSVDRAYFDFLRKNGYQVKPDLGDDKKKEMFQANIRENLGDYFLNFPEDCGSQAKLKPDQEAQASKLKSDVLAKQSRVSTAESDLDFVKSRLKSVTDSRDAEKDESTRQYYGQQIAELAKKIPDLESKLKAAQQDLDSSQARIDAIYSEFLVSGKDALGQFRKRTQEMYERDYTSLVSSIMLLCADEEIKKTIESRQKDVKDKREEIAAKAAANADADQYAVERINEDIAKFSVPSECSKAQMYDLRDAAVQLFRVKDPEKSKQAIKEFVEKKFALYLNLKQIDDNVRNAQLSSWVKKSQPQPTPEARKDLSQEAYPLSRQVESACNDLKSKGEADLRDAYGRFFGNIAKSKSTIEAMLDSTYSTDQKAKMTDLYKKAHAGVMSFIEKDLGSVPELKGTEKFSKMKASTARLAFS